MCHTNKRYSRARFGILLIVIGLLWFAQRAGWFPLEIFGPLVLLTLGIWMIATSYIQKRQASTQSRTNNNVLANRDEE
jgi:putative Mn2+ efflux pump MntP